MFKTIIVLTQYYFLLFNTDKALALSLSYKAETAIK